MGRVLLGAVVGAVIVFAWGFLAWPTLHLYDFAVKRLPNEAALVDAMRAQPLESGAYVFPGMASHDDAATDAEKDRAMNDWKARHFKGPIGMIVYRPQGMEPMSPFVLVRGFAMYVLAALMLGGLLAGMGVSTFAKRLAFVMLIVAFAMIISHGSKWNWFAYPDNYAIATIIDGMVAWTLGGVALAGIIKVRPAAR